MSSSDRKHARLLPLRVAGVVLALGLAAGCTVRPLYGDMTAATPGQAVSNARLAAVEVKPVGNRVGQEVRNHLIFLLGGGGGQPANPAYSLELTTYSYTSSATAVSTSRVSYEPTAGIVTVQGSYRLVDAATGEDVATGNRSVQAPYDIPGQEYAALRAVRDAENRAARELAELLRLVVAQALDRQG